ncbi:hypothetical protein TWF192_001849 [Orbilia oligospora]|nr:hypothetical protein TWF192_001849 [Orbilia oligospora]
MPKRNRDDEDLDQFSETTTGSISRQKRCWDIDAEGESAQSLITATPTKLRSSDDYTIGWVCALPIEMAVAIAMLDQIHASSSLQRHPNDHNTYTLGEIGDHNVAIACLPSGGYGVVSAATVASQMSSTFTSINSWLMVGVGGGVPDQKNDIRLGDIVVSHSVIQYDYGKTLAGGRFERTSISKTPSQALLTAINKLRADHEISKSRIPIFLSEMLNKNPEMRAKYVYQGQEYDFLYEADYDHPESQDTCELCQRERLVGRHPRNETSPRIYYGPIASGNQVMKHGITRDRLKKELEILCFEMEAAGLMDNFPCLVIRGICDYADSHKNKKWQEYSAATAAAYTKELLLTMPAARVTVQAPAVIPATDLETMEKRKAVMDALKFNHMDNRQVTIKTAHAETCRWLLTKPEFKNWLDDNQISDHHGFLWIKGKPGTGKSTLMKFALKHCERTIKKAKFLSFFFNARGEGLEKSTIGMYRSLLYQLLKKIPRLQTVFDTLGSPETLASAYSSDIRLLQDTFSRALGQMGQGRLVCFIDALDECDEDQIREMLNFLWDLGVNPDLDTPATSGGVQLRVCFSSRHYPHITLKKGREMILEGQEGHDRDIVSYLATELIGKGKTVQQIREEILKKSSGIFLWVVLVVQILNKVYDGGGRPSLLRQRLEELPVGLSDLFKEILIKDTENKRDLLLCIEWILHAKRPLKPVELYIAILSGNYPEELGVWDPEEITEEDMGRFILNSSKGLAEFTKSSDQTVQFIHESVRDFLIKENGLNQLWSDFGSSSHERLKLSCFNYINIDMSQDLPPSDTKLPSAASQEALEIRELASTKFPFLEYAVQNVLYHADLASNSENSQEAFINNFPLGVWIFLNNLVEKIHVRRYHLQASFLYIFSDQGLSNLVRFEVRRVENIDIMGFSRYSYPITAALANGHEETVKELLISEANTRSTIVMPRDQVCERVKELLKDGRDFKVPKRQPLLFYAAEHGKLDWAEILLATGKVHVRLGAEYSRFRQPLSYIASHGSVWLVDLLLAKGAHIDHADIDGRTPLSYAAEAGHEGIVSLLLAKGADIENIALSNGRTPLSYATEAGNEGIVSLLLAKNADINKIAWFNGRTPLSYAVEAGHKGIVSLLLAKGADIDNIALSNGRTPLSYAAEAGHEGIVSLLLAKDADINKIAWSNGRTPLSYAAEAGHKGIVSLLLAKGADIGKIALSNERTPLSYAAEVGHKKAVNILLDRGANIDTVVGSGMRTPLSYAAASGHGIITPLIHAAYGGHEAALVVLLKNGAKTVASSSGEPALAYAAAKERVKAVKLLLDHETDPNLYDKWGLTPLLEAALVGNLEIVNILLERGANTEFRSISTSSSSTIAGRTPLSFAAESGNKLLIELLLGKGEELDSRDDKGRTPLMHAARNCKPEVVIQLLESGANPLIENNYGKTALSYAKRMVESFYIPKRDQARQMVKILSENLNR